MNKWSNSRWGGILTCHHYHSTSHEVIGVYRGETILQLGGEDGTRLRIAKGDVLIIPAGVAYKNLGQEHSIGVVAAYPGGMACDMNYENAGDRSLADKNIEKVPLPLTDPVGATASSLPIIWALSARHKPVTAISWMKGDPRESLYKLRS